MFHLQDWAKLQCTFDFWLARHLWKVTDQECHKARLLQIVEGWEKSHLEWKKLAPKLAVKRFLLYSSSFGLWWHPPPGMVCQPHCLQLIDIVDLGRYDTIIITINCALNELCTIMSLEALDNALIHRLDVHSKVWHEIFNTDIGEIIWNHVAREIVLK